MINLPFVLYLLCVLYYYRLFEDADFYGKLAITASGVAGPLQFVDTWKRVTSGELEKDSFSAEDIQQGCLGTFRFSPLR